MRLHVRSGPAVPLAGADESGGRHGETDRTLMRDAAGCGSPEGSTTRVVSVPDRRELPGVLRALGLDRPRPVMAIVGSAGSLPEPAFARLRPLFAEGLAPLAARLGAAIVDGGTDAGVMRLAGQARQETGGGFPLVGVAPADKVAVSADTAAGARLEAHHTQVLLVPGASWASGTSWLAEVAGAIAGPEPSVTIVIGGGTVTWDDAEASVSRSRPLLAVHGTGGVADTLAAARYAAPDDPRAAAIAASGLLHAVELTAGPAAVAAAAARLLHLDDSAGDARPLLAR